MSLPQYNLNGLLADILPIRFDGGFRFESFSDTCMNCGSEIPMQQFRSEGAWIGRRCCQLTLTGACLRCGGSLVAEVRIRAQDWGKARIENLSGGKREAMDACNTPLSERALNLIKQVLGLSD